jgi:hypothetical protein
MDLGCCPPAPGPKDPNLVCLGPLCPFVYLLTYWGPIPWFIDHGD